jgi:3-(3-hydroxy-phenyl)propionate hydroxylase
MVDKHVDVVIVGYGPVGATAANLLGIYGIKTLVLDRQPGLSDLPRASAADDEVMRIFQYLGLADRMLPDMHHVPGVKWVSSTGDVLAELEFSELDAGHGYPSQLFFWQPLLEKTLREYARASADSALSR